jgi:choloylglycine hydrolase
MCTHLSIPKSSGVPIVTARSLDFDRVAPSVVSWVPKGANFPQSPGSGYATWTTTYGFVAAGIEDEAWYMDGLNDQGVSFGSLWLPGTTYPAPASSNNISALDVSSYVLGMAASAQQAAQLLLGLTIVAPPATFSIPLHYVIADATGSCIVIELSMNGTQQVQTTYPVPNGVVTNAPPYPSQVDGVYNYVNLTTNNNPTQVWGQQTNGSGMVGLPGDATPPSRFVRASLMLTSQYVPAASTEWPTVAIDQNAIAFASELLRTVMVPRGTAVNNPSNDKLLGDFTQWTVVRDHTNLNYYFSCAWNQSLSLVQLSELSSASAASTSIVQSNWCTDVTTSLGG